MPTPYSVPMVEADRDFDSLRALVEFQRLMDEHR